MVSNFFGYSNSVESNFSSPFFEKIATMM